MQKDLCSVWFMFIPRGGNQSQAKFRQQFWDKGLQDEFLDHCVAVGPLFRDYLNVSLIKI